MQDSTSNL